MSKEMVNKHTNPERLAAIHLRIRTAREELKREYEQKDNELKEQQDVVNNALIQVCDAMGADSIRTAEGTVIRSVSTRYWTSDWEAMRKLVIENDAFDLLEKRIHQTNMKEFLQEHPDLTPVGLNVNSEYKISVRKPKK